MIRWFVALLLLSIASAHGALFGSFHGGSSGPGGGSVSSGDEFVGPFASWYNARILSSATDANGLHGCPSNTGGGSPAAVGNGVADDTAALNRCLADLGDAVTTLTNSPILWLPAGTYKVTSPGLSVTHKLGISILGENPATTIVKWSGTTTGQTAKLFNMNGIAYSRVARITWDGSGDSGGVTTWDTGGVVLIDASEADPNVGYFDTGNEFSDNVFKDAKYGWVCARYQAGCAETTFIRNNMSNISWACVFSNGDNALDLWVRYSVFDHCNYAVSNWVYDDAIGFVGAGNFHVFNNIFRNSYADVGIARLADGTFNIRNNYSINSSQFIYGYGTANPAATIVQGNTIIDTQSSTIPAIMINYQGPSLIYDNKIRNRAGFTGPALGLDTVTFGDLGDAVALSNTFTVSSPISSSHIRLTEIGTSVVSSGSINATEPTLPGVEPNMNRTILEAGNASQIQSQITTACTTYNGQRAVVHMAYGSYSVSSTITIPANCDVQLVGDGYGTRWSWAGSGVGPMLAITGPTKATLREFRIDGNAAASVDVIKTSNIDQVGSRVYLQGLQTRDGGNADLFFDTLDNTAVDAIDLQSYYHNGQAGAQVGIKVLGGSLAAAGTPANGRLNVYSALVAEKGTAYQASNGGTMLLRALYYENPVLAKHLDVSGRALVTLEGQKQTIACLASFNCGSDGVSLGVNNLNGKVSVFGATTGGKLTISGTTGALSNVLGLGLVEEQDPAVSSYFFNTNTGSTGGLLNSRYVDPASTSSRSSTATNQGTFDNAFVTTMFAQTRAATESPLTSLPSGVTDLRMYRTWAVGGVNNVRLAN